MRILLVTNILIRNSAEDHPEFGALQTRLSSLLSLDHVLLVAPQSLYEFWSVATRPLGVNGMGLLPSEAATRIERIRQLFPVLPDPEDMLDTWLSICIEKRVRGKQTHDARLVAWMMGHGVTQLLTLNPGDLWRFSEIKCLSPADV